MTLRPPIRPLAFQRRLDIKVDVSAPMVRVATAVAILEEDVDAIAWAIEERRLAWAWDIGTGERRAETRILTKCVRGYQATGTSCNLGEKSEEEIIGWILARENRAKSWIEGVRLKFLFACENSLINALVDAGELKVVPGTKRQPGPHGSDKVLASSVREFLTKRRIK